MVKTVQHEAGALTDTALVVVGWVAFVVGIAAAVYGLSLNLAPMMDARYPRLLENGRRNLPGEEEYQPSVEAIVCAINMIASAWEGWLHQSKAQEHYGKAHPIELEILQDVVIPSAKERAFNAGLERAKREKSSTAA